MTLKTVSLSKQTIAPRPFERFSLKKYDAVVFWDGSQRHLIDAPRALFRSADGRRLTVQSFYPEQTVSSSDPEATIESVIGQTNSQADYFGVRL